MSTEDFETVWTAILTIELAIVTLVPGCALLWWGAMEIRDSATRSRWKRQTIEAFLRRGYSPIVVSAVMEVNRDGVAAKVDRTTEDWRLRRELIDAARVAPPTKPEPPSKPGAKKDDTKPIPKPRLDRDSQRLAKDLILGLSATRRFFWMMFILLGVSLAGLAFKITVRHLSMTDGAHCLILISAMGVGVLVGEFLAIGLTAVVVPVFRGKEGLAAERLADALVVGNRSYSLRWWRRANQASTKARMKTAFAKAGIPLDTVHVEGINYDAEADWESFIRIASYRLARAYCGDYCGKAPSPVRKWSDMMRVLIGAVTMIATLIPAVFAALSYFGLMSSAS